LRFSGRHSFATHQLAGGYDIRTAQEPPGHSDVKPTMVYTHVLHRGGRDRTYEPDCPAESADNFAAYR
jgi:site-specific recombinase XerD